MVLLGLLFLGAIDEELRDVPKNKRKFNTRLTKKEQMDFSKGRFPEFKF